MKKVYGILLAAALVVAAAPPVRAIEEPAEQYGQPPAPATAAGLAQQVSGNVTAVDQSTGSVALSTSDGTLKLHFPPQSIQLLKKGDTITAQFSFTKASLEEGATRAFDMPKGLGEHRMTGTVSMVDHAKGWLHVESDAHVLELHFPPQAVEDLHVGDRLTVELAFSKTT